MSDQRDVGDPAAGGTGVNKRYAEWQQTANDTSEDQSSNGHASHSVPMDFEAGNESSGEASPSNLPATVNSSSLLHEKRPIKYPENVLEVVFHLYVHRDAEKVTIEFEKPLHFHNGLTLHLRCMSDAAGKYWKSGAVRVNLDDNIRYRYIVKYHHGSVKKVLNYFKSVVVTVEADVKETGYKRTIYPGQQYDVFKEPKNPYHNECIFAGQFFFVKMLYDSVMDNGTNLKETMIECEHVGFGHPSFTTVDRNSFLDWIKITAKQGLNPPKSAYACALLGQFLKKIGYRPMSLNYYLWPHSKATVDPLLFNLRLCSKQLLPSSSLNLIKSIDMDLLEGSSNYNNLGYILHFGNIFDATTVVRAASNLRQVIKVDDFDQISAKIVDMVSGLKDEKEQIMMLDVVVNESPTLDSLWKLCRHLETKQRLRALIDNFVARFSKLFTQIRNPDLLNTPVWKDVPNALKPKLANSFCDAVIEQVKTSRECFEYGILKDLILDKDIHQWATTSLVNLLRLISGSRNKALTDVLCEVLNAHNFNLFWEKMNSKDKESIIQVLMEKKVKKILTECHSNKEKVIGTFQVLQELSEIRAIARYKGTIEFIGKYICQETQRLGLKAIVDAYDDVQSSLRECAKMWFMSLLTLTVQQQQAYSNDVKLKLIEVVRSSCTLTTSSQSIEIDGGREVLLLMLVGQTKLPKGKEQIDQSLANKVIGSVLSNKDMWTLIFQASGKTGRLHEHPHYKTVKKVIAWLSDALISGCIPINFLKSNKDDDVAELLTLTRCSTGVKGETSTSLFEKWQEKLITLSKEREKIDEHFCYLKKAIDLVAGVTQDNSSLRPKDFDDILQEYNERKNNTHFTTFADFRQENYWGPLMSLLAPSQFLHELISSRLFVNFANKLIKDEVTKKKEAVQDEMFVDDDEEYLEQLESMETEDLPSCQNPNTTTVEEVLLLLTNDGVTKFIDVFKKISKMEVSSDEIDILFNGVGPEELDRELELIANLLKQGRPPNKIVKMLHNYAKFEDTKERIQKALKCLHALGYSISDDTCEFLDTLESFLKCKDTGTLESISKQVDNMMHLDEQLQPDLVDILSELSEATELINFIIKTAKDNMVDLVDAVEEHSDQLIQESTVSYLIDVHRFLSAMLFNKPSEPETFLDNIAKAYKTLIKDDIGISRKFEKSSKPKTKMAAKIKVCSSNVHSLRGLYLTLSNRGELTKEIIKSAVNDGCYQVGMGDNGNCEVFLTYTRKDQTKTDTKYNMDDLNDLRSRALLIVNADKSAHEEVEREASVIITSEELHQFIEQVDLITEITRKYDALRRSGIPKYRTSFWKMCQSTDEIREEEHRVEKELNEWDSMLHKIRNRNFFLNYFHATQLWELRSFFQDLQTDKESSDKVLALFRCIDSSIAKKDLPFFQSMYKHPKKNDILSELQAVGSALEDIFRSSEQKALPTIASTKKIDAIVELGKLYVGVLEPGSAQTVHVIMSLFLNTCASLPKPSQLLFCHSQTTWEEIELLLLRTFEAHSHGMTCKLHCLANVESLPNDIQFQLVENLKRMTDENNSPYLLAVVCRGGSHHHIADQFDDQTHYFGGMADSELRERFKNDCPNTLFVISDLPGLGKTEEIYLHAAEIEKTLVSFPVSGPFSRKYLVDRLCDLKLHHFQALHFDIGEVDDPNGLDTFLFEMIVTGMVSSEAQLFTLPTNHIYIEIANTLQQTMRDSLPISKCFRKLVVELKDCNDLISSNELTSPVQVVCQYLNAYDSGTLESQEIIFHDPKKVKPLSSSICGQLLSKHFFSGEDLSFNILENFISVLADQLMKFTRSPYFKPRNLVDMVGKSHDVRVRLFKALLKVAISFAARSITTCRATQAEALSEGQARDALRKMQCGSGATAAEMVDRVKGMIQWADNEHLVIMLHGAGAVTAIYRDVNKVPKGVKDLFQSQSIQGKGKGLEDYKKMTQDELQTRLERISDAPEKPQKAALQSLDYALTPDNILKMALIIQRMQANIPVIIMGETGCGKTSLVQYLAKTCDTPFCVFNFHAGITEKEIIDFISARNEEAKTLQKKNKSLWVFLDEINTCDYLGTINEIVCHRSFHGKPLASNLVFVAACNPYRLRPSGRITTAGLEGKTVLDEYSKLVYRVHPLPETMIDYVWDYGSLGEEDEKAYIGRMVEGLFDINYIKLLVELLAASQKFVREADQSSFCVSLRDVHRTTILIKWFYKMLQDRPGIHYSERPRHLWKYFTTANGFDLKERSIVLSLAHCYLSRLPTTDMRQSYCKEMIRIFAKNGRHNFYHPCDGFEQIIRAEQEDWLLRMELPPGTARNAALRENVFVILVCILNRIPVFVVGKPGCSKSLSMQVIRSNLRGRDSKDPFLKTLPQLFVVSFQGSESSTSEGIEKVFEKARKYKTKTENVLPVVLLDEIGLAEISKFNPLKVLHRLLEPGKGQFPDVAVVGISNWSLDAAKMNRAVHLSRPEPDESDLYETGLSIREVQINKPGDRPFLRSGETRCKDQLRCLAESYHQYQSKQTYDNFHGLRDYYSMVKCLEISTTKPDQNNENIQRAMQRNFGGLFRGKGELQTMFLERLEKHQTTENVREFPVTELIRENLGDRMARHLMIITNGDSAIGILDQTLADLNKEQITIFGSQFEEDLSADYNHRVLSRIILCMEQNCVLILRDLEGIYGSLYDMLNQNYIVVGGKKNCRIALGAFSNPMCQVDDGFRCIVLVDENKVDYSDPPFLNRFEKQLLRFSDVLDAKQKEIIMELREWVKSISTVIGHEEEFCEVDMFAGFHEDTLPSLVLLHSQNQDDSDKEDIIAHCKDDLMYVATPDAVIRARKSLLHQSNDEEVNGIYQNYFEKHIHEGLKIFLQHSLEAQDMNSKSMKLLVMTHSSIHTDVAKCVKGIFNVQTEKLGFFKSEKELSKRMQHFWRESKANLLVVQCRPDYDAPHMLLVKTIIEQKQKEYMDSSQDSNLRKHVCIVIHLQREVENEEDQRSYRWQFNFLSGWRQVMIDVLERPVIKIKEILENSIVNVFDFQTMSFNKVAAEQLLWCFTRIKYPPKNQPALKDTIALVETLTSSVTTMECFKKLCCEFIEEEERNLQLACTDPWQVSVACDRKMLINCSTLVKAMQYFVTHIVRRPLTRIVYFLQKESAWKALTECGKEVQEQCQSFLCVESVFNIHDIPDPQDAESLVVNVSHLELQYPFSYLFFKRVDGLYEFYSEEYRRKCFEEEDNLNDNGELLEASKKSLIARVSRKVQQVITEMLDSDYLVSHIQDYLDDALDIKSEEFSQHLTRHDRISLLKAHFVDHFPDVTQGDLEIHDVPHIVTQLHGLFWMEGDTIAPLLHFVQACIPEVPLSIDELITKFNNLKEEGMKKKERAYKHEDEHFEDHEENIPEAHNLKETETEEEQFTEVEPRDEEERTKPKVPEEHDEKDLVYKKDGHLELAVEESLQNKEQHTMEKRDGGEIVKLPKMEKTVENYIEENQSAGATEITDKGLGDAAEASDNDNSIQTSDDVGESERRSENGSTEENIEGNKDGSDESVDEKDDDDDEYDDKDGELHDTNIGEEKVKTFEEFIVQEICASLFPTDNLIEGIGGIAAWKSVTTFVLSTATTYYTDVPAFHYLKVCYDLSDFVHSETKLFSLYALGLLANHEEEDNYLDSMRIFEAICDCIADLREDGEDGERLDEFLFLFYSRCIASNPDTPLMGEILKQISFTNDERLLQLSVPSLCRIFRTEQEAFYSETFLKILDSPDDLDYFPNLIQVNVALSKLKTSGIDELDCHFHVICCDLINRMAFKDLNLEAVSSSEDPVLKTFLKAKEMFSRFDEENDTNRTFGFICAVSYLRAFMSSLARLIIKHRGILSKHNLLLSDIFKDLNETLASRMGSLSLSLVKELRQGLCMHEIRQLVDGCEKLHPLKKFVCWESTSPKKIGYDPFQSLAEQSEAEMALGKHVAGSDSKPLDDVLSKVMASNKRRTELAAVAFEQFYLVRSIRKLKDTEDNAAEYILDNLAPVTDPYKRFLHRIGNHERFKCSELEVTPDSKAMDVEVAVLIQHLSAIITSRYTGNSSNPVVSCLVDPTMMHNSYILAAPDDSSGYSFYKYFETTKRSNTSFYKCSACCTKFTTREDQNHMKCPNCSCSCERKEMKDNNSIPKQQMGYVYCKPETMRDEMLCTRNLNPVEFRILHLIIHVALVAGYSLDLTTSNLAEFMKVDNPSDVCFQYIQVDLDVLSAILCRTKDRIIALLHQVLEEATPLLTDDSGLPLPHDEKTRLSWESYFSKLVRSLVQRLGKDHLKPKSKYLDVEDANNKDFETLIEELEEPQFPVVAARNVCLPRLFRTKHQNYFEKLREFYLNSSDEVKEHHQLLGLFLDYHKTLDRIGNLVVLNSWSRRVDVLLSRSLTRADAKKSKIGDAVISKVLQRHQIDGKQLEQDSVVQAFEEFKKAWDNVAHLFNDNMEDNKHISEICPVGLCLVERKDLGRHLCATLVGLANVQNEFLDKCLAIAASGNCSALQFLCKNSSTYSFPSVHVQDAKQKEIIQYEWTDDFLDHSRYNLEYGHGTEIIYDLAKIEKDMAGCFLLGKAYLTTSKGMREFVFSKQLFHDCANILNDLDHAIPQERLPSNVETELSGSVEKSLDNIQVLLEHMEIVLCFLKRTEGKPEESLLDYVETWMTASRPFPKELLPKSQNAIQLRHVCALYEFLEDKLAVKAIGCVSDEYRKPLSEEIKVDIQGNAFLQDDSRSQIIIGATVTAIKRFIFRYLNMKPAANNYLVEFMEDPSLWPMSIRAKQDHNEFKMKEVVPTLFPKGLSIAHAFEAQKYYQGRLDELNPKKQRTNPGLGIAARARPTTSRPRDKKRKTQGVGKGFN